MNELNFGQFIRKERMALGLSLSEVALDLKCSAPYLSGLETGKQKPSDAMIKKLSALLQINIVELTKRATEIKLESALRKIPQEDLDSVIRFYQIKKQAAGSGAK